MSSPVQSKTAVGDSCDLTQYTIVKGGTSCVFGTCQGAANWSALVSDFLLVNLVVSARYSSVIAINFDRQDLSSAVSSLVSAWNKQRPLPVSTAAKLMIVDGNPYILGDGADASAIVKDQGSLDRLMQEVLAVVSSSGGNGNNMIGPNNCAVVIYSISELILTVGFRATRDFLRKLTIVIQEASTITGHKGEGATFAPAAVAVTPCIVLVVNESLHGPAVLAQIQSLASVVVRVVPNNGTLSDTVVCEVQTVRRSATTGKISESVEMFSCRESLLCPLKPVASYIGADDTEEAVESAKISKSSAHTVLPGPADSTGDNGSGSTKVGDNKGQSTAVTGKQGKAQGAQQQHHNQRLITFDSTDPEFDEDSDPDADLDL